MTIRRILRWAPLLLLCLTGELFAQAASAGGVARRTRITITANLQASQFDQPLPFDEVFIVKVAFPPAGQADTLKLIYGPQEWTRDRRMVILAPSGTLSYARERLRGGTDAFFAVGPLLPRETYLFEFQFVKNAVPPKDSVVFREVLTSQDIVTASGAIARRGPIVRFDRLFRVDSVPASVTTFPILTDARAAFYQHFDQDIGVLVTDRAGYVGAVTSIHLYPAPINKNARLEDMGELDRWLRRVSLFGGLAVAQFSSSASVDAYFAAGSPTAGVAVRPFLFFMPLRLGTGLVWFKQDDANPLVSTPRTKVDRFAMVSVDFDVRSIFGPLLTLAGLK